MVIVVIYVDKDQKRLFNWKDTVHKCKYCY